MNETINGFLALYHCLLFTVIIVIIPATDGKIFKNKKAVASMVLLACTGWIFVPWIALGCYKINRANLNLVYNRDGETVITPAPSVEMIAPVMEIK